MYIVELKNPRVVANDYIQLWYLEIQLLSASAETVGGGLGFSVLRCGWGCVSKCIVVHRSIGGDGIKLPLTHLSDHSDLPKSAKAHCNL